MDRRNFIGSLATGSAGIALSTNLLLNYRSIEDTAKGTYFDTLTKSLLVDWCDGMIRRQINEPDNPKLHGALACPACDHIHGRCSDALYPFLHLANVTGDAKYTTAAIDVYNWAEHNVKNDDGSWRNDIRPKAWRGTTIFGAIALAEALHYHGKVLDEKTRAAWTARLDEAAGGYLYRDFKKIDFTNLNYGMTGVYGFHLFGTLLKKQKYLDRSQQFAKRVKEFFTEPNTLLWGEGKPNNNRSGRGLLPVDLGYNVEESLNGVVLYALEVNDTEMLDMVTKSLSGHLEFMLPDGAWDNSWGTRSQKWSYWGSRTSDGCQPGFSLMADRNPAFGTAAIKNAELLKRCTADGLIHGGPHYVSHGVNPCIHHTFAHAKVMALVQDKMHAMPKFDGSAPLPRATAKGVKHFPELDVWLVAKGPWRSTVSAYDSIYKTKRADHLQQPTGGSMAVLYHDKVGTLLAGSMARYIMVEPLNMQPQPDEDFPLTPRIETRNDDAWFTNLYDLKADVKFTDDGNKVSFDIATTIQDEDRNPVESGPSSYKLQYAFEDGKVTVAANCTEEKADPDAMLVIPILSPTGEKVTQVSKTRIEIVKPEGTVVVESNAPLTIKETAKGRVFNMVPGAEAVPIMMAIPGETGVEAFCTIAVS
ncbi:hypothetical protein [Mariniblastus fucicola]|uniref:Uncharacterized protein n=1 Tax=Mariniblastus fucicola TaxID=980251 RepID=A0A5B9PBP3_9BACT|nr:hypothetical protein [Mariniblastus fucicola]QEG22889.1 hypothetical protein MFFC18_27770 [Mariniblastus fucicola]